MNKGGIASLALALAAVVAGCGSGGDSAPLTKAEFVKQANAVCGRAQKQMETEFTNFVSELGGREPKTAKANEAAQTTAANEILIPGKTEILEGLEGLNPPKGDGARVKAIIRGLEDGLEKTRKDLGHALTNSTKAFSKEQTLAVEYGLKSC